MKALIILILFTCMFSSLTCSDQLENQNQLKTKTSETINQENQSNKLLEGKRLTMLAQCVVISGIIVLGILSLILFFILAKKNKELQEQSLKLIVIVTIIIGSLLILTLKENISHLAPLLGLFGTIAGYLLGKGRDPIK